MYTNYLYKPPLPDKATLEENRKKRISDHQLLKIFYQLVAFGGVLYIVYMISFESRDPQSYYFKKHMEDMMGFDSVCTLQEFEPHLEKSQDILSQSFDVIQSDVLLHKEVL